MERNFGDGVNLTEALQEYQANGFVPADDVEKLPKGDETAFWLLKGLHLSEATGRWDRFVTFLKNYFGILS